MLTVNCVFVSVCNCTLQVASAINSVVPTASIWFLYNDFLFHSIPFCFISILIYPFILYCIPFYFVLFYDFILYFIVYFILFSFLFLPSSIPFCIFLFYSHLYSILCYCFNPFDPVLLASVSFNSNQLLHSIFLYSILFCSALFHSIVLFCSTSFISVLPYAILLYSTPVQCH